MTISNIIEAFIKNLMKNSDTNLIEIQRNELAKYFNCAPSQINYVLTTRFTLKQGYSVESQRGGGGSIKIKQLNFAQNETAYHIITNEIRDSLTLQQGNSIIKYLLEKKKVSSREAKIMKMAIDDTALILATDMKNQIRARLLKNMLRILLEKED